MMREVCFDSSVYSLDTIKKSLYRFSNLYSSNVMIEDGRYVCHLYITDNLAEKKADYCVDELRKEVLDQDLREKIKKETEATRNLILAFAFSKTDLV